MDTINEPPEIAARAANIDELTLSVTKLAIAWSEGDRESAEILFRDVLRFFRRAARSVAARCPDRTPTEVINEAYIYVHKIHPTQFRNRKHFLAVYIKAMNYWLNDHWAYLRAGMRKAHETDIGKRLVADESGEFITFLSDLNSALNRLVANRLIEEDDRDLFFENRILGISYADLAELNNTIESRIRTSVTKVKSLVAIEMAAYNDKPTSSA